jgi:ABC-type amino acid transport substrate-binding protein
MDAIPAQMKNAMGQERKGLMDLPAQRLVKYLASRSAVVRYSSSMVTWTLERRRNFDFASKPVMMGTFLVTLCKDRDSSGTGLKAGVRNRFQTATGSAKEVQIASL